MQLQSLSRTAIAGDILNPRDGINRISDYKILIIVYQLELNQKSAVHFT